MQVVHIEELEDGSALVQLDMSAEEIHQLIESAFTIALCEGLKRIKQERIEECLESVQSTSNT